MSERKSLNTLEVLGASCSGKTTLIKKYKRIKFPKCNNMNPQLVLRKDLSSTFFQLENPVDEKDFLEKYGYLSELIDYHPSSPILGFCYNNKSQLERLFFIEAYLRSLADSDQSKLSFLLDEGLTRFFIKKLLSLDEVDFLNYSYGRGYVIHLAKDPMTIVDFIERRRSQGKSTQGYDGKDFRDIIKGIQSRQRKIKKFRAHCEKFGIPYVQTYSEDPVGKSIEKIDSFIKNRF